MHAMLNHYLLVAIDRIVLRNTQVEFRVITSGDGRIKTGLVRKDRASKHYLANRPNVIEIQESPIVVFSEAGEGWRRYWFPIA